MVKLEPALQPRPVGRRMTILTGIEIPFSRLTMVAPVTALAGIWCIEVTIPICHGTFCAVALTTVDIPVAARQWPARQAVVKAPLVQLGNIVTRTKMFAMALVTGLLTGDSRVVSLAIT